MTEDEFEQVFLETRDPKAAIPNCPAGTTLLYAVCGNDPVKFDEANRLIQLFVETALARAALSLAFPSTNDCPAVEGEAVAYLLTREDESRKPELSFDKWETAAEWGWTETPLYPKAQSLSTKEPS